MSGMVVRMGIVTRRGYRISEEGKYEMTDVKVRDESTFELVLFRLRGGATEDDLLRSSEPVSDWASEQPGFIDRKLIKAGESGTYVEIVRWRSLEDAMAAATLAESSPICAPMFALIEPGSAW